ncbi:hypothetical protein D3C86_1920250 [compost metagenome]
MLLGKQLGDLEQVLQHETGVETVGEVAGEVIEVVGPVPLGRLIHDDPCDQPSCLFSGCRMMSLLAVNGMQGVGEASV